MSEKFSLDASSRDVVGKKVKNLRAQGLVPAVIYGREFETMHISLDAKAAGVLLRNAGGTHIIELKVGGKVINTLAREVQRDPIKGGLLHIDFYRVAMDRPIRAEIPLVIVGESPIVGRDAILVHPMSSVEVECLPADLPAHIDVDITGLTQIGDLITVGDLSVPRGVTLHANSDDLVARIDHPHLTSEADEALFTDVAAAEPEVITKKRDDDED